MIYIILSDIGMQSDFECGGSDGKDRFDDEIYALYGPISGFRIWHGGATCVIDG